MILKRFSPHDRMHRPAGRAAGGCTRGQSKSLCATQRRNGTRKRPRLRTVARPVACGGGRSRPNLIENKSHPHYTSALLPWSWTDAMSTPPSSATPVSLADELESSYAELHRYATRKYAGAAGDIVHDAWIRLASREPGHHSVRDPLTYLRRVVDNVAVDRQRLTASRSRFLAPADAAQDVPSAEPSPYAATLGQQEYAVLLQAIRDLPAQARRVFVLFRGRNLSMAQIAAQLDISPRTVEKHIAVALAHCRRRLREAGRDL
ncbi:RNA polymerase sigma factor [Xanthomonas bonasiae]|uniref:RNA polymerase sigma factor n=1 Tax=Xanthomonas bonasiae TaxID=2810351 RepID=UPI001CD84EAB|nr:sigma-70 family RNA polymerase sigma factor [Xanthomonas surreyensis]